MADIAQKAEMRRRRILMKSEERMKKLLGPNAIERDRQSEQRFNKEEPVKMPEQETSHSAPIFPVTIKSQQVQDHTVRTLKAKKKLQEDPNSIWISDIMIFPVGAMTRIFPVCFVPVLIGMILLILIQTSTCSSHGFWAIMVCQTLGIDPRKSFGLKVLSLVEKAFQIFLMFSFSFIIAQALILICSGSDLH